MHSCCDGNSRKLGLPLWAWYRPAVSTFLLICFTLGTTLMSNFWLFLEGFILVSRILVVHFAQYKSNKPSFHSSPPDGLGQVSESRICCFFYHSVTGMRTTYRQTLPCCSSSVAYSLEEELPHYIKGSYWKAVRKGGAHGCWVILAGQGNGFSGDARIVVRFF